MNSPISSRASANARAPAPSRSPIAYLILRLHFYVGLFIGPFLLIAAASGALYALTPQIEEAVYAEQLFTANRGDALPLAEQIAAARRVAGPDAEPAVIRPAPEPGTTTRVMFNAPGMNASQHRAIFVDPITAEVKGDLTVYGTSGVLPVRAWLDLFHRELQLGAAGRWYSELAASWLWIAAIGGLVLWFRRARTPAGGHRLRRWHARLGVWAMLGFVFFSATGLTWSQYAGSNIGVLRAHYGWGTPGISTNLTGAPQPESEHAHHQTMAAAHDAHAHHAAPTTTGNAALDTDRRFDQVLAVARAEGLEAGRIEVRRPASADRAWSVVEIDRRWPTQVDAAAIDPRSMTVIDRTRFETFPIAAKLTRWGIDAHMGVLFGWINQLVLIVFAFALVVMVVWGYLMWWRRRPTKIYANQPRLGLVQAIAQLPTSNKIGCALLALALGYALPVMGVSLLVMLIGDSLFSLAARRRAHRAVKP